MGTAWMKLAFAVAFGVATTAVAIPDASALAAKGCSANCSKGSCSTSNSAKDCGCCSDGTPYCGAATDCSAHKTSVLTTVAADIVSIGGEESGWALVDSLKASLDGSKEASMFVEAVAWYTTAVLGGFEDEIDAAQEYVNDAYSALPDEEALVALRVTLNGLASPAAPPADPAAPSVPPADSKAPPAVPDVPAAPSAVPTAPAAPPADAKAPSAAPAADPAAPAAAAVPAAPPSDADVPSSVPAADPAVPAAE